MRLDLPTGAVAPAVGEMVGVTGASSCEKDGEGKLRRVIRVPSTQSLRSY